MCSLAVAEKHLSWPLAVPSHSQGASYHKYNVEKLVDPGNKYSQKNKNKAKWTKPSTRLEEHEKTKPNAYSVLMGQPNLSTIPKKESDEFIKSNVEDLVPIPKESEDTSNKECDFPACDNSVTFSNPLFDANDDFTSSNEDVLENIESKESYVSNLDEPDFLVTPLSDANKDECFDLGGDIVEIDADVSMDIEDGYHDLEGDIIYLKNLLINDTIPNLPPEVFSDHDPRSLKDEPDNDDLKSMVKVFDPRIHERIISLTYVRLPFEDHHFFPHICYQNLSSLSHLFYGLFSSSLLWE
nr:hypothetical protein [Tanacetum cinerariifolium]